MDCVGAHPLRGYDEEYDQTSCFEFNDELIEEIRNRGWIVKEKLAEGGTADVFTVIDHTTFKEAVLLLQSNDFNFDERLEIARHYPDIFPEVYDIFHSTVPYTLDENYPQDRSNFTYRTIQVIEKMDMDLHQYDERFFNGKLSRYPETQRLREDIENRVIEMRLQLLRDGYAFVDVKSDNIGVNINPDHSIVLKLIDIESMRIINGMHRFDRDHYLADISRGIDWS